MKKGDVYKSKSIKGKHTYQHLCDIKVINLVDEYIYNYFKEKIMENFSENLDAIFDEVDI